MLREVFTSAGNVTAAPLALRKNVLMSLPNLEGPWPRPLKPKLTHGRCMRRFHRKGWGAWVGIGSTQASATDGRQLLLPSAEARRAVGPQPRTVHGRFEFLIDCTLPVSSCLLGIPPRSRSGAASVALPLQEKRPPMQRCVLFLTPKDKWSRWKSGCGNSASWGPDESGKVRVRKPVKEDCALPVSEALC